MATTQTPRSAAAKRRSAAAKRAAQTREENQRTPVEQVQQAAQRAVLIPVGAALTATDRVTDAVTELARVYGTPETAQKRVERDLRIKRTRTRVERELRQRRVRAQRLVKRNSTRVQREVKAVRRDLEKRVNSPA